MTVGQMPPPVNNPLAAACYYDQPDIVKALLASGADPLAGGDRGDLAIFRSLFCAIRHPNARSVTCIELLLATDKFELVAQRGSTCSPSLTPAPAAGGWWKYGGIQHQGRATGVAS